MNCPCVEYTKSVTYVSCVAKNNSTVVASVLDDSWTLLGQVELTAHELTGDDNAYTGVLSNSTLGLTAGRVYYVLFDNETYNEIALQQFNFVPSIDGKFGITALTNTINNHTSSQITTVNNKIETAYLGNKKMIMSYCTEVPTPNPRGLFIGAEDYVTEYIKDSVDVDWKTPVSTKIIYYWYEDQKLVKVGEEE
jgi:hypothetical protein